MSEEHLSPPDFLRVHFENASTWPLISLTPYTFNIGPYIIKDTSQQQVLSNPSYSIK